jgi:hypothetical protein
MASTEKKPVTSKAPWIEGARSVGNAQWLGAAEQRKRHLMTGGFLVLAATGFAIAAVVKILGAASFALMAQGAVTAFGWGTGAAAFALVLAAAGTKEFFNARTEGQRADEIHQRYFVKNDRELATSKRIEIGGAETALATQTIGASSTSARPPHDGRNR